MGRLNLVLLFCSFCVLNSNGQRAIDSFVEHEIIPDVLSVPPAELLSVIFPSGEQAMQGNSLSPSEVTGVPKISWNWMPRTFYTLVMCDADAPSRREPEARSFLHWLVVNIRGGNATAGETLTSLLNSHPEPLTGPHRYIFLLYQQPGYIDFEEGFNDDYYRRVNFMPEDFANKYKMGAPLAGNFHYTNNNEEVYDSYNSIHNK
ncbi:protein D2-like [Anticarsia gemmatalis]|uniref:protein D2-like n=1 Tax=Anticarsia gemmatalis TaxID=129554 RepID=UPI003F776890